MVSVWLIVIAIGLFGFSGVPGLVLRSAAGQRLAAMLMLLGGLAGAGGIAMSFKETAVPFLCAEWFLPWGRFFIKIDPLSVVFLVPVFVIPVLGSIYGLGYWKQSEHPENAVRLGLFYGLLAGAMAMVVVARDGVLFLVAWEVMALSAYFAATAEDTKSEVRKAGWIYLVATHTGTLVLIAMFALWNKVTGSFSMDLIHKVPAETAGTLFLLALIGFGFKAGLMPLHVWLPGAHANAPSHVSAVMSGVMLKMGIYGIVRMSALLPELAAHWGGVLLAAGAVTGIAGIAFAIGQSDLKRVLAYSSIENIGIIVMGLAVALLGRAHQRPEWILLGLAGGLLHVWNHAFFKSLLFFSAGAVMHAAHTRQIDRLGGLSRRMPVVTVLFVFGAAAICALPPLNGFVSEWLIYLGLFKTLGTGSGQGVPAAALAAAALALIGALALACFVRLLGTVFLGIPRSDAAWHAADPSKSMLIPMGICAAVCGLIGLVPAAVLPLLDRAAGAWAMLPSAMTVSASAPLGWMTGAGLGLMVLVGILLLVFKSLPRAKVIRQAGTWDCGYAMPTPRMQYTGSSLGQMLVKLFGAVLWPRAVRKGTRGLFAKKGSFKTTVPDAVLDRMLLPVFALAGRYLPVIRFLQQGRTHLYVLYILVILIVLMIYGAS